MTDEQRKARLHHHMYETCEGIAEHAERIVRLEEENENLTKQVEALKDYAHALELCKGDAYLCEYCTFNSIDFEHDDINCTIDFDGLRKKAGMDS
jgi:hypothetical protein